jgi:glutamine amidotransferase
MIAIIDTGTGNLSTIERVTGGRITSNQYDIDRAEKLIFPGVGSFQRVVERINPIRDVLLERIRSGIPYLGICLGLEILFDSSEEGSGKGFGIIPGRVKKFSGVKTTHMGWNQVRNITSIPIMQGIPDNSFFYFMHSYYAPDSRYRAMETDYMGYFTSGIAYENIYGVQFHPEKSGNTGIRLLKNFRVIS